MFVLVAAATLLTAVGTGHAYRPFDGTDADVVGFGELEIALGPLSYLLEGDEHLLLAPDLKLSAGCGPRLEAGLGAAHQRRLGAEAGSALVDTRASLKVLLRKGSLQAGSGPSLAIEAEALLPQVNDGRGAGAALILIMSQLWPGGAVHLTIESVLSRGLGLGLMGSLILEGPAQWRVRPVI